jgi:hypothetical protein
MQKNQNYLLLACFLAGSMTACHKHEDDANDPVITITAPAAGASISGGVTISGVVTDESLHEMTIKVTKDSDNSELFTAAPEVHDLTTYTIAEVWTPSGITAETAVTLTVIASDHSDHTVTTAVKFTVKP